MLNAEFWGRRGLFVFHEGHCVQPDGGNDWRRPILTSESSRCLGCGYSLMGLTTFRCPECGQVFDPADRRTYATETLSGLDRWARLRSRRVIDLLMLVSFLGILFIIEGTIIPLGILLVGFTFGGTLLHSTWNDLWIVLIVLGMDLGVVLLAAAMLMRHRKVLVIEILAWGLLGGPMLFCCASFVSSALFTRVTALPFFGCLALQLFLLISTLVRAKRQVS